VNSASLLVDHECYSADHPTRPCWLPLFPGGSAGE
jgi:hypothetical protein